MYTGRKLIYPLDPECPAVIEQYEYYNNIQEDPMTIEMGAGWITEELHEEWEPKHRTRCKRCQEYGAANVDVNF